MLIGDPVDRDLPSLADVAVSIYLPKTIPAGFQLTGRYASQTNYLSPLGNFSAKDAMPVGKIMDDRYILSDLVVVTETITGVTHAVICLGIDDIRNRMGGADENVTADRMIAGLKQRAPRAKAQGIEFYGGTLLPFENEIFSPALGHLPRPRNPHTAGLRLRRPSAS